VMVWVHGGGFSTGAGSDYDPAALATEGDLVVVTVNYRLGALGFLGLPGLPGSGSFALQDQQAALRWVRDNIAAFGGDPGAVTLAGESAGADAVCSQLASPDAAGLFARAIVQSGSCHATNVTEAILPGAGPAVDTWKPLALVEQAGLAAAAALGCPDPATAPACLRALPAEALLGAAGTYWSPAIGTPTLPERPSVATAQGAGVPVLTGTTDDEGAFFAAAFFTSSGNPLDAAGFTGLLGLAAGPRTAEALAAYPLAGRTPDRAWADVITDRGYACPNLATYDRLAAGGPVYAYEFADPAAPSPFGPLPADLRRGAPHGSDVPSLFALPAAPDAVADPGLAAQMRGYWARFAATGDPNGAGAPRWEPVGTGGAGGAGGTDGAGGPVLRLAPGDVRAVPAADLAAAHRCALWS
jgi:para-nitrobenzyl esterase